MLAVLALFSVTPPGRAFWKGAYELVGFSRAIQAPLEIHFLDVGKADAILISCEGELALLDAGTYLGGETVADYAARNRLGRELTLAFISHPDSDHMDGMVAALEDFSCEKVVRGPDYSETYELLQESLGRRGIPVQTAEPGDRFAIGGAQLEVLGPVKSYSNTNDASLVLKLTYRGLRVLFCGDMEKQAERDLLESGADLSADVLKAAHHGSKTSSTAEFLEAVRPKAVVVSTGPDRNRLPNEEALIRLEQQTSEVYRTDVDGTVILTYGEEGLVFLTEREGYRE